MRCWQTLGTIAPKRLLLEELFSPARSPIACSMMRLRGASCSISRIVKRGAPFLFTSGDVDNFDCKEGKMNGVTFRYFSYSVHSYRRILGDHGFTLVDVHADSGNNTYYLAKKAEPPS